MSKLKISIALLAIVFSLNTMSQEFRVTGIVRDSITKKTIENVAIEVTPLASNSSKNFSTVTSSRGAYSLNLPAGGYTFKLSIIGYSTQQTEINVNADSEKDFILAPQPISLGEIVVSSLRVNRRIKELPTPLAVVGKYDYQQQSSLTLSDVLAKEPGIAIGGDGVWATNVNIRGLSENRLVTLIDGNRIETATDLTASLSMIDVNEIERVEVVKGAQSSLYGTGAMGGIVNIITKDGHFSSSPYVSGNVISGFASANEMKTGHAAIDAGGKKWYLRVGGTYNDANNIKTPDGILPNSQFASNNISAKLGLKPFANHTFKFQFQRNWATDVGIPGGDAFPGPATATYSDIGRQLFAASYEIENISERLSNIKVNLFNQYILRDVAMVPNSVNEITIPTGTQRITAELVTPTGEHMTNGAQFQTTWNLAQNSSLIAGVDMWQRKLTTEREKFIKVEVFNSAGDLVVTNNLVRGETPTPTSTFGSAGIFVQNETKLLNDNLKMIIGGRFDGIKIKNEQGLDIDYLIMNGTLNDTPPNQRITFEEGTEYNTSWSANAGILYSIVQDVDISLNMARSFRSPSLEERFKYIDLGNLVRLGDPTLKPESGYSADLGFRIWKPGFSLQVGAFSNLLSNMIVEVPGEFIYTINTGPSQGIVDTLPALVNTNISKAMLYGADFGFEYSAYTGIVLFGSGAYVIGKDTESDTNLPLIPPLNGRIGIRYTNPKIGSFQTSLVAAAEQDKIADGEQVTQGYHRIDIAISSVKMNLGFSKVQLFGGVDNLLDESYTNHLSTNRGAISVEPGRNIYLRLSISF